MKITTTEKVQRFFKMYPPMLEHEMRNIEVYSLLIGYAVSNLTTGQIYVLNEHRKWKVFSTIGIAMQEFFFVNYEELILVTNRGPLFDGRNDNVNQQI